MAQTCPQCQSQASDEANHCPSCGAALSAAGGPGAGGPGRRPAPGRHCAAGGGARRSGREHVRRAALQVRRRPVVAG